MVSFIIEIIWKFNEKKGKIKYKLIWDVLWISLDGFLYIYYRLVIENNKYINVFYILKVNIVD